MAYTKYSLVPDDNNSAPPNGAPEGMLPSGVNNTMRDMMAQIRDVGDGIRDGTYTITSASITGGSVSGITDLAIADGGTGQSTASAAFNALSPITTTGDLIIGNGTNSATRLGIGSVGTVLQSNGTTATWTAASGGGAEIGALQYFEGIETSTYPDNAWLPCNNSVVTQTAYSVLYGKIGNIQNNFIWTAQTTGSVTAFSALTYGNNLFVAGQSALLSTSTDGITWTARTSGVTNNIFALAYGNNTFVYAGQTGILRTSTDAITWTARTSGTASQINALIYENNLFVYGGNGGVLATSTDAITWTARTSGTASQLTSLTYGEGVYIYSGAGGVLATSTDGITWTARTSGTNSNINTLAYGNNLFVYGTIGGRIATSRNAINWSANTSNTASNITDLAYGNNLFVYGGAGGAVATNAPFTYNTATEFITPLQESNITKASLLYIKAE